jgi:hypothetical protein
MVRLIIRVGIAFGQAPELRSIVASFRAGGGNLGILKIAGRGDCGGWQYERLQCAAGADEASATARAASRSFAISDHGKFLACLGSPMRGARSLPARLIFPGRRLIT